MPRHVKRSSRAPILLIGGGRMGCALLSGWIANKLAPVVVVEPKPSRALVDIASRQRVVLLPSVEKLASGRVRACVVALKPQVLRTEAVRLKPIAQSGATMISIAAGTNTSALRSAWGKDARIVRAMPNTPGAIGKGISGLFATPAAKPADKALAESLLAALGDTVWVKKEALIDSITAVSGSGPAYVFLLVEALARAAMDVGLPREVALKLARATVSGSGALLDYETSSAEELRRAVTSPGGTTEAALAVLMGKQGLAPLIAKAVKAARSRAEALAR